jgi:chemotaxis protein MotB
MSHPAAVPGLDDHEEHENHERWLVTYADMITLLMVLFIVLYAIGQTDLAKFQKLKEGMGGSGGGATSILEGGAGPLEGATAESASPIALDLVDPIGPKEEAAAQAAARADRAALAETRTALAGSLAGTGLGTAVSLRIDERGLVVTIASDPMLFDPGQATLRREGQEILDKLAPALAALPNRMSIEGHTDDVPISGTYASNWELSSARAMTVLRALEKVHGIGAARLSVAGYADQRPVADNATPAGRAANRRVEIVVLAQTDQGS